MKRIWSLILAALLLASSTTACGSTVGDNDPQETKSETDVPETKVVETAEPPAETDAPSQSYDASLVTENGIAKAHIVLFEGASDKEKAAAEELVYHIRLVSGAEVPVSNEVLEDSLPIIIATPDSLPALEELFPEDLAWLRTVGKVGDMERYGDDGFAVRQLDGKIYIFGANPYGALNGTYDFIEENLDLIWIRGDESGIIYDEMPTIQVIKADYREKSPFQIRWHHTANTATETLVTRNKYNTFTRPYGGIHNVKWLVTSSPIYDPNITEYWETSLTGSHYSEDGSRQINYWSELTADTVAASVLAQLDAFDDASRPKYFNINQEDNGFISGVYPEEELPFEYAPGQFVDPSDKAYISTVYFTFINRIARKVAEKYPDVNINTLVYVFSKEPPVCDIEDNVTLWFCNGGSQYAQDGFDVVIGERAETDLRSFETWVEKHPNINLYTYYFTHYALGWYERPLWHRLQNEFRYYAERGVLGLRVETTQEGVEDYYHWQKSVQHGDPEDFPYTFTQDDGRQMNLLTYWIFYKLAWNPNEDVDALVDYFCDKVYGDAAEHMKEYYRILEAGWKQGGINMLDDYNSEMTQYRQQQYYYDYFLDVETADGVYVLDALKEALSKAWEAADDHAKEFIRRPYEVFEDWERFLQ